METLTVVFEKTPDRKSLEFKYNLLLKSENDRITKKVMIELKQDVFNGQMRVW